MSSFVHSLEKNLKKKNLNNVECAYDGRSIILTGNVDTWDEKIEAGYIAARFKCKGVVNDIIVSGVVLDDLKVPEVVDNSLDKQYFDVVVIGGGVTGTFAAREFAKWNLSVLLIDKEEDFAKHASSRNDGVIHPGFAAKPGTLKAELNVKGNEAYTQVAKDLKISFHRPGSYVVFESPLLLLAYPFLKLRAIKNKVPGTKFISRKKMIQLEPWLDGPVYGAFHMPTAGQLSPYRLVVALAENCIENGVQISLNTAVTGFDFDGKDIKHVLTNRGKIGAGLVVNAAGVWADTVAEYAGDKFYSLHYRKGVDVIVDRKKSDYLKHIVARPSVKTAGGKTKGGGLIKTVENNILIGPTAYEQPQREDYSTRPEDIAQLQRHFDLNKKINRSDVITYFAGIRACTYKEDFIIEASEKVGNFIHAAGIQSPGLAAAPAVAKRIVNIGNNILKTKKEVKENPDFNPERKFFIPQTRTMATSELEKLIAKNPLYGKIVCRCEQVSEGEIRDVFKSPFPPTSLDGIKRRTGAISGRCHGGFCTPRIIQIFKEETGLDYTEISKKGPDSRLIYGRTKENITYNDNLNALADVKEATDE
jgi:glycerol-3-phosphate dehydrogenase